MASVGAMYIQGCVPTEPKQMFMIPRRNGVTGGCEAPHMGSRNQSPAFCRRSISTLPLNHLSRPWNEFLKNWAQCLFFFSWSYVLVKSKRMLSKSIKGVAIYRWMLILSHYQTESSMPGLGYCHLSCGSTDQGILCILYQRQTATTAKARPITITLWHILWS